MFIRRDDFKLMDKVVLGRAMFRPPFKASSALQNEARFVYVFRGNSRLYSPKNQLNLNSGDSIVMKCENFVNNWFPNENNEPTELIVIHFFPEILKYIYEDKIPDLFSSTLQEHSNPVEKIPPSQVLENFSQGLLYYLNHPTLLSEELIKVKIRELILILVNSDQSGRIKSILSSLFQPREYEFQEIIRTHLFEDLKIEDLAFFAGLSLSSFKRKFNVLYGTSPNRYIKKKRLEKAQQLLENTDMRISEIAYDCGFNDIGYFSKTFHATFNCSPSSYRKSFLS